MVEKLYGFYEFFKTESQSTLRQNWKTLDSVNKSLSDACQLSLKKPILGKQLVLMTDAGFKSAGYALMSEDNPNQKIQSRRKTYAPVALRSKFFSQAQLKMPMYSKDFSAIYMAFLEHTFCWKQQSQQNSFSAGQQIRHTFFPNKGNSASTLECMWVWVAS